jgi:hypothetical protein
MNNKYKSNRKTLQPDTNYKKLEVPQKAFFRAAPEKKITIGRARWVRKWTIITPRIESN